MDYSAENLHRDLEEYFRDEIEEAKPPADDEFTLKQLMAIFEQNGAELMEKSAAKLLEDKIKEGTVTKRKFRRSYYYKIIENEK